jgi:triphosphoribosyl-dephospho-CoA synthase
VSILPSEPKQQAQLADIVRQVCELEVRAFKPGNVSVASSGHGMRADDFLASARAMAGPLCSPGLRVGQRVHDAIAATQAVVNFNTNLGIVLLAAPLVQAALRDSPLQDLRARLEEVLAELDINDAELSYQAIRLAAPGGLGSSERHDVNRPARVTLLQAMAEARERDTIARAYVTGYADVFLVGVPLIRAALARWGSEEWAIVAAYLGFLSRCPDTHIQRKFGYQTARDVSRQAAEIDRDMQGAARPEELLPRLTDLDHSLKSAGINPGTSADLSVASLIALRFQQVLHQSVNGRPANSAAGSHPKRARQTTNPRFLTLVLKEK